MQRKKLSEHQRLDRRNYDQAERLVPEGVVRQIENTETLLCLRHAPAHPERLGRLGNPRQSVDRKRFYDEKAEEPRRANYRWGQSARTRC